jgi:hypothetical protein
MKHSPTRSNKSAMFTDHPVHRPPSSPTTKFTDHFATHKSKTRTKQRHSQEKNVVSPPSPRLRTDSAPSGCRGADNSLSRRVIFRTKRFTMDHVPLDILVYIMQFIPDKKRPRAVCRRVLTAVWRARKVLFVTSLRQFRPDEAFLRKRLKRIIKYLSQHFSQLASHICELDLHTVLDNEYRYLLNRLRPLLRSLLRCFPAITCLITDCMLECIDPSDGIAQRLRRLDWDIRQRVQVGVAMSSLLELTLNGTELDSDLDDARVEMEQFLATLPLLSGLERLDMRVPPDRALTPELGSRIAGMVGLTSLQLLCRAEAPVISIGELTRLRVLHVCHTIGWPFQPITGSALSSLQNLACSLDQLTAATRSSLESSLTMLEVYANRWDRPAEVGRLLHDCFPRMSQLRSLVLSGCLGVENRVHMLDTCMSSLRHLPLLTSLQLLRVSCVDPVVVSKQLSQSATALKSFQWTSEVCVFRAQVCAELCQLAALENLSIGPLTHDAFPFLTGLHGLTSLHWTNHPAWSTIEATRLELLRSLTKCRYFHCADLGHIFDTSNVSSIALWRYLDSLRACA